jgi:predicted RNase H-like nuclease (RuvC/YqgF family)
MKKMFVGILIGAFLTLSTTALASGVSDLIGKKVDGVKNVSLNGDSIGQAVIIQGKSYLPVRDLADGYGSKIEIQKGGDILLTTPTDTNKTPEEPSVPEEVTNPEESTDPSDSSFDVLIKKIGDKKYEIERAKSEVSGLEKQAIDLKERVDRNNEQGVIGVANTNYEVITNQLKKAEEKLSEKEKELTDLEAQLAELQK